MAEGLICDRCGKALLVDEEHRYEVTIRIVCPYDVLERTREELEAMDTRRAIEEAAAAVADRSAEELKADVWEEMAFDLCPPCRASFRQDPLGRERSEEAGSA